MLRGVHCKPQKFILNRNCYFIAFMLLVFYFSSELKRAKLDLDSMRKQAEATNNEYDRLLKEHAKLQVNMYM